MRIRDKFEQLKKKNKKAFIGYVPFGFPKIKYTKDIILTLAAGLDLIEVGIPFSDPLADGPLIQRATSLALDEGATVKETFKCLGQVKGKIKIPLVVMTYYNPVLRFGMEKFLQSMKESGVGGLMIVDLPLEESKEYIKAARRFDIDTVFFITPTTSLERAKKIAAISRGFIYYISITGITGPKDFSCAPPASHIRRLRKITKLPICVGFGIHTSKQVRQVGSFSDGVIVGSRIVKFIEENWRDKNFLGRLKAYIESLKA
ncbi:MAG: tryptophan synthase subunit alpha [Candidatus Omnitrophota bacterium]|nr:MAG: tryptophan synthase subunit alpha [Candidatus Omnitrophota bacterium]